MTTRLSRREFIASLTLYSAAFGGLLLGSDCGSVVAKALAESHETDRNQPISTDRGLINIKGQHLNFGTSLYPFRSNQDPQWLFQQARDLGLTEVRLGYPRDAGVTPSDVGLPGKTMPDYVQAKCVLRATMQDLIHGVEHLDIFSMYYPEIAHLSLIRQDKTRRPSWFAYQRLLAAAHPKQPSVNGTIERTGTLSGITRDLSIATPKGFTYCIWQETPVTQFKDRVVPRLATVRLKRSDGQQLLLLRAEDPLLGQPVTNVRATLLANGELELAVPTMDYPIFCMLTA